MQAKQSKHTQQRQLTTTQTDLPQRRSAKSNFEWHQRYHVNDIQLYAFLCELLSLFDWFIKCKQLRIDGKKEWNRRSRAKKWVEYAGDEQEKGATWHNGMDEKKISGNSVHVSIRLDNSCIVMMWVYGCSNVNASI